MFESSLFASAAPTRLESRWPAIASFLAQSAVAVALVALPLLHPAQLATHTLTMELTPPKLPSPPAPRPPLPRVHVSTEPAVDVPSAVTAPHEAHARIVPASDSGPVPEGAPSVVGLNLAGPATSPLSIGIGTGSADTRPRVSVAGTASPSGPARISTGVSAGLLLTPIRPEYPAVARAAHQQGMVEVEATISRTGAIESAHAINGPVMLRGAAVDAVRSARYRPFLLNGQPTEVNASFSIHFSLNP